MMERGQNSRRGGEMRRVKPEKKTYGSWKYFSRFSQRELRTKEREVVLERASSHQYLARAVVSRSLLKLRSGVLHYMMALWKGEYSLMCVQYMIAYFVALYIISHH
jgi:hypothetical protein